MKKKIATLTFHWATNYGAVLQAYALQKYLINQGYQTEIINYVPWRVTLIQRIGWIKNKSSEMFIREKKLENFRKEYLKRTKKVGFNKYLKQFSDTYDFILCGSDQIWNESFTLRGEGKPTLAYFLEFAGENTKRIAYAVSFGSEMLSREYKACVSTEFNRFIAISTREISGKKICHELGKDVCMVCDPTLLLPKAEYIKLIKKINTSQVFTYILHQHVESEKIAEYILKQKNCEKISTQQDGLIEWISRIYYSELVVTNSFHGVMLSLILNKPFVAILIKDSGMNDRIKTILSGVGLEERIVMECDTKRIDDILNKKIDWLVINHQLDNIRNSGINFLEKSLNNLGSELNGE